MPHLKNIRVISGNDIYGFLAKGFHKQEIKLPDDPNKYTFLEFLRATKITE